MQINLLRLMDEKACYELLREIRWTDGLQCPHCQHMEISKNGMDEHHCYRQRYKGKNCNRRFDDLTNTIFSGSSKELKTWLICMYLMGLNISNSQIAKELEISEPTAQLMTEKLRAGIVKKKPTIELTDVVEIDEVYVVCGHKGQPEKVKQAGRSARRRRLKGARGRGTLANEKPPILGLVQRGGALVMRLLPNVKQVTIKPIIEQYVRPDTLINTDEYSIYNRLKEWGYSHKTVCHSSGEYARDEDGDGFHEVHVNTQEGIWSLLRSWLRPHRGISQEKMPIYVGFFEFVFNIRKRGKALLEDLFLTILKPDIRIIEDILPSP